MCHWAKPVHALRAKPLPNTACALDLLLHLGQRPHNSLPLSTPSPPSLPFTWLHLKYYKLT